MKNVFRTLVFKKIIVDLGYAYPIKVRNKWEFASCGAPIILQKTATLENLKKIYSGIDLDEVKLVEIQISELGEVTDVKCKSCGKTLESYAIKETGLCSACFTCNA